jgi:hypothetical protein
LLITVPPDPDALFIGTQNPKPGVRETERARAYVASSPDLVNPRLLSGSVGSPAASGRRPVHLQLPPAAAPPLSPNPERLAWHSLHSLLLLLWRPSPTAQAANSEISRTERTTCRLGAAPPVPTAAVESYRGRPRRESADDGMARLNGEAKRRMCAKTEKTSPLAPALAREMRLGSGVGSTHGLASGYTAACA